MRKWLYLKMTCDSASISKRDFPLSCTRQEKSNSSGTLCEYNDLIPNEGPVATFVHLHDRIEDI